MQRTIKLKRNDGVVLSFERNHAINILKTSKLWEVDEPKLIFDGDDFRRKPTKRDSEETVESSENREG